MLGLPGVIRPVSLSLSLSQLVGAMEELSQCRLQQWNISATVDKLTQCLPGERETRSGGRRRPETLPSSSFS